MKIVFFGTPEFASKTLAYLVGHSVDVAAVVTKPDKPVGRSGTPVPPPVKATAHKILPKTPVFQPAKASTPEFVEILSQFHADFFVVVAYGEIINQALLDLPRIACINVHASLLPKYRGAAPIQRAIMEGEKETGVTIMHMVKKLDAGPMVKQVKVKIGSNMTAGELHDHLQTAGSKALLQALNELDQGIADEVIQNEADVTYAKKLELEDCEVKWSLPARQVHNLIRGTTPYPGAWCWVTIRGVKKRIKILLSRVVLGYTDTPGSILQYSSEGIIVACGEESLRLLQVKLEGKKAMPAEEFTRGIPKQNIKFNK